MNKEDLVKLVSTDTTWLSEKQHDELRSNLKVKFKHLNLKGSFLNLLYDDKKNQSFNIIEGYSKKFTLD
jgi:hypothetical protein